MSDYCKISLVGAGDIIKSRSELLLEIEKVKAFKRSEDSIYMVFKGKETLEDIDELESACYNDTLADFVMERLVKEHCLKSDSNSNLIVIPNPELYNEEGKKVKRRKKNTHLTPKKKKRK